MVLAGLLRMILQNISNPVCSGQNSLVLSLIAVTCSQLCTKYDPCSGQNSLVLSSHCNKLVCTNVWSTRNTRPRMLGGFVLYCGFSLVAVGSSWFVSDLYIIFVRFWDFIILCKQYSKICCCPLNDYEKENAFRLYVILDSQNDSRKINVWHKSDFSNRK